MKVNMVCAAWVKHAAGTLPEMVSLFSVSVKDISCQGLHTCSCVVFTHSGLAGAFHCSCDDQIEQCEMGWTSKTSGRGCPVIHPLHMHFPLYGMQRRGKDVALGF